MSATSPEALRRKRERRREMRRAKATKAGRAVRDSDRSLVDSLAGTTIRICRVLR